MSKMSIDLVRHALKGFTMGTRWQATFFAPPEFDPAPVRTALQAAVDEVDAQMSTWKPDSDLMRLNVAPVGAWVSVPDRLREVLLRGLEIGRASKGGFDLGMGDAVTAWGFGPEAAAPDRISAAISAHRVPAHAALEIDDHHVRKSAPIALDLNGIAKGYGVDRLAEMLRAHAITDALVGIDGEMRALGLRPDGQAWTIAVEAPDLSAACPSPSSRCRTLPWRLRAITAIGSRCRAADCRTPWTRTVAGRWHTHPPRSRSWRKPAWPRMHGPRP